MMCAILMLGGANLLGVGLVGLYLSKVYSEVKRRPMCLVAEEDGESDQRLNVPFVEAFCSVALNSLVFITYSLNGS